jgi:hypothetical protein
MTEQTTPRRTQPARTGLANTFVRVFTLFAAIVVVAAGLQRLFQDTAFIPPWGPAFALWGNVTSGLLAAAGLALAAVLVRMWCERRGL